MQRTIICFSFVVIFRIAFCSCSSIEDSLLNKLSISSDSQKVEILYLLGERYTDNDSAKCFGYAREIEQLSQRLSNNFFEAYSYVLKGHYFKKRGNLSTAIENYKKASNCIKDCNNKLLSSVYNNIGATLTDMGSYAEATSYLIRALKISEKYRDELNTAKILLNLGLVFFYQRNYVIASYYYGKSLEIREKINDWKGIALLYNNLGIVYYYKNDKNKAVEYFKKALEIYSRLNNKRAMSLPLFNIAEIYSDNLKYDSALQYYNLSYSIDTSLRDKASAAKSLIKLAAIYEALKNYSKALEYANKALNFSMETGSKEDIKDSYFTLSEVYKSMNNYKLALEMMEKVISIKDSLYNDESAEQIARLQTMYETEKKDLLLSQQKETIRHQKQRNFLLLIGMIIISSLFLLAFIQFVQKKKAYTILELQKKNITDSINYASRIQAAILPPEELLNSLLPEHFILYLPKEMVSGDFYWVTLIDEKKLLITLADCTGHGVPGAFMSMLGFAYLSEIVNRNSGIRANEILNQLRIKIKNSLHQKESSTNKDGMDIALVIINLVTLEMEYSGANNPVIIHRDGVLTYLKPDKMPIGIHAIEKSSFTLTEFKLQKNDTLYLFSDGYIDQFGGPKNKKLGKQNYEKIIAEAAQLPIKAQRYLFEEKYWEWLNEIEQIDDISIMGIKIT